MTACLSDQTQNIYPSQKFLRSDKQGSDIGRDSRRMRRQRLAWHGIKRSHVRERELGKIIFSLSKHLLATMAKVQSQISSVPEASPTQATQNAPNIPDLNVEKAFNTPDDDLLSQSHLDHLKVEYGVCPAPSPPPFAQDPTNHLPPSPPGSPPPTPKTPTSGPPPAKSSSAQSSPSANSSPLCPRP